jgi:hypothetical protein
MQSTSLGKTVHFPRRERVSAQVMQSTSLGKTVHFPRRERVSAQVMQSTSLGKTASPVWRTRPCKTSMEECRQWAASI